MRFALTAAGLAMSAVLLVPTSADADAALQSSAPVEGTVAFTTVGGESVTSSATSLAGSEEATRPSKPKTDSTGHKVTPWPLLVGGGFILFAVLAVGGRAFRPGRADAE